MLRPIPRRHRQTISDRFSRKNSFSLSRRIIVGGSLTLLALVIVVQYVSLWIVLGKSPSAFGEIRPPIPLKSLKSVPRTRDIMAHSYITLWLHQFHSWFGTEEADRRAGARQLILDAREAGFGAVMVNFPWAWTEREAPGQYDIHSFQKDWVQEVCQAGLKLHVVLTMTEFPPWVDLSVHEDYLEDTSKLCNPEALEAPITEPSSGNPLVWRMMQDYVGNTTQLLTQSYGDCLVSVSPNMNNEFETRYTQTHSLMRDYSSGVARSYQNWQQQFKELGIIETPPNIWCGPHCEAITQKDQVEWMAFREDFLVDRYTTLCRLAKNTAADAGHHEPLHCLLHMAEMLASTDHLHSNTFFQLATSDAVDELVMDSNMMLVGAPTSPGVVGLMVSMAMHYANSFGKVVHYELATERVLPCDEHGQIVSNKALDHTDRGAGLLMRSGVWHALQAGVHSLGVTNLCKPKEAPKALPVEMKGNKAQLLTAESFTPTAVLFIPYRVFYAYSYLVAGVTCNLDPIPCWHKSFANMKYFGLANLIDKKVKQSGMCPVDAAQATVLAAWEDLRQRHAHVAVMGDVHQLEQVAALAQERVLIRFPCVMQDKEWHIFQGQEIREAFEEIHQQYPFTEKRSEGFC